MLGNGQVVTGSSQARVYRRFPSSCKTLKIYNSEENVKENDDLELSGWNLWSKNYSHLVNLDGGGGVSASPNHHLTVLDTEYIRQAKCMLRLRAGFWDFNIFTLDQLTNGRPLLNVCIFLFQEHGLIDYFQLDVTKIYILFRLIEEGYHLNPYHNSIHAADVTQAMHCFLKEKKLAEMLSPLEILSALIAAAAHDIDHPGVNQLFLTNTCHHLAALYNNSSVLENHHWHSAISVLNESKLLHHLTEEQRRSIRWQIKSLILATDISQQQKYLSQFQDHLNSGTLCLQNESHRHLIMQMALKCADVSNPCRHWDISRQWSVRISEEFFHQGDRERRMNLPVSPSCNRNSVTLSKMQTGFMQFIGEPLFFIWEQYMQTNLARLLNQNMQINKSKWLEIATQPNCNVSRANMHNFDTVKRMKRGQRDSATRKSNRTHNTWQQPSPPLLPINSTTPTSHVATATTTPTTTATSNTSTAKLTHQLNPNHCQPKSRGTETVANDFYLSSSLHAGSPTARGVPNKRLNEKITSLPNHSAVVNDRYSSGSSNEAHFV